MSLVTYCVFPGAGQLLLQYYKYIIQLPQFTPLDRTTWKKADHEVANRKEWDGGGGGATEVLCHLVGGSQELIAS